MRTLRAQLLAWRGRFEDAHALAAEAVETAARIGDIQAVLPPAAALASALVGLGEDAAAVAAMRRGIELRGDVGEATISGWYLFEVTDSLSAISARDRSSPVVREGVELLAAFARHIAPDAAEDADLVCFAVRKVVVGAAIEQLARLAGSTGVAFEPPDQAFPGTAEALALLDREHRPFDVARISLWLAEAGEPMPDRAGATATFEELGAHPYLERIQSAGPLLS